MDSHLNSIEFFEKSSRGPYIMALFEEFHKGCLFKLNFCIKPFLLKEFQNINKYGPICLLNVIFKNITKVGRNRLSSVVEVLYKAVTNNFHVL
jgi:hypothetical protein